MHSDKLIMPLWRLSPDSVSRMFALLLWASSCSGYRGGQGAAHQRKVTHV